MHRANGSFGCGAAAESVRELTPELQLHTLFVLDERGCIVSTREPSPTPGPRFVLIRGATQCAWATRADMDDELAGKVHVLAGDEPPTRDFQREPVYATRYIALLGGRTEAGPAFTFPAGIAQPKDIVSIDELSLLERHFRGWTADEIPERSPIMAIMKDGAAISVCFCARRSATAAEAGVETAERFRGRGFGARVTAAWARAIEATGRVPIYSTSWTNSASLALARKLSLDLCASDWSLWD